MLLPSDHTHEVCSVQPISSWSCNAKSHVPCGYTSVILQMLTIAVAERDFRSLDEIAARNPDIAFVAVSHSSEESTARWLDAIGGKGSVQVIVDESRQLYADWGLGPSSWSHVLSPGGLAAAYKLGKEKAIWNRPTESGSRWQTAGTFAMDRQRVVRWARKAERADEEPDWQAAIKVLKDVDE